MADDACPRMTAEERWAAGFRMIHPKEGNVRCAIGVTLFGAGVWTSGFSEAPFAWPDLLTAAGIMLYNMGRKSQ